MLPTALKKFEVRIVYAFCVIVLFKIVLLLLNSRVTFKALRFDFWCFNATFNNISAISWRPVLVVERTTDYGLLIIIIFIANKTLAGKAIQYKTYT
jgi:hypothetical protein